MKIIRKENGTWQIPKRRSWWEINEATKQYVKHSAEKWHNIKDRDLANDILKLPPGFTCWSFSNSMTMEERFRLGLISAWSRPGALEYCLLEIDRGILRKMSG